MSPTWKRPPLPEETFSASFGEGEGELLTLVYPKPLPMRLDRWLVSQRTDSLHFLIGAFLMTFVLFLLKLIELKK